MSRSETEIGRVIVDAAIRIHKELGPGLLEMVYQTLLARELSRNGLDVRSQVAVPIDFDGIHFDEGFRADLIVEMKVIVELKSVEQLNKVHFKQLLTYLRLKRMKLGFLLNFGAPLMKEGIRRVVNGLED